VRCCPPRAASRWQRPSLAAPERPAQLLPPLARAGERVGSAQRRRSGLAATHEFCLSDRLTACAGWR